MSASAITDALINNLSAASAIGSCQVATHYAVLETTAACAGVVTFSGVECAPWTHGNAFERFYTHRLSLYVKDRSGNVLLLERDWLALFDTAVCSLESDRNLGSEDTREISTLTGNHDPETVTQAGGATWYTGTIDIRTRVWPDN